jgi:hypothetical protein
MNIFEMKVYRRILGPVYDNEKENWRILTNKEMYAVIKKPTITETIMLQRLRWFGHVQRMEENRTPKRVLYMNLETTRLRGRPRNRWQGEVMEDGRIVGGEEWQEKLCNIGMEEAPGNGKESSYSAHANGMNECGDASTGPGKNGYLKLGYITDLICKQRKRDINIFILKVPLTKNQNCRKTECSILKMQQIRGRFNK